MRTSLIKILMPVAAFMLASAGAVGTKVGSSTGNGTTIPGWARPAEGQPCEYVRECNNNSLMLCKQGSVQVFIHTGVDDCSTKLYHSGI